MDIKFDNNGLIPAIAQDAESGKVLMAAYMNRESLLKTIECKKAVFYSRSRQSLWTKGETSGNYLEVEDILIDCDSDALLLLVRPMGPACHTGEETCFFKGFEGVEIKDKKYKPAFSMLKELYSTVIDRRENPKEGSYTNYLFDKGIDKILKKVGEETAEVIIGAKNSGTDEIRYEIADLMYHLSVLMAEKGLTWDEVFEELRKRHTAD